MKTLLLNRFQGALLGSALTQASSGEGESSVPSRLLSLWLESGRVDNPDWREIYQKQRNSSEINNQINNGQLAVLLLPLTLFFHDSSYRLETQLRLFFNAWELSQDSWPEMLLWGQIISLTLRDRLQPNRLIPQLLAVPTPLKPQLEQLQQSLGQNLPLAQVIADFRQSSPEFLAIAAALYCFASTPTDFRLSILRATTEKEVRGAAALTGALAGAYNSISGIPAPWRLAAQKNPALQEIPQQAKALLAVWSGNYCDLTGNSSAKLAVAAAGTIQPRRSWQMISQR